MPCGFKLIPSMDDWFFEDGLYDLRDNVLDQSPVWGSYIVTSTSHTWIGGNSFYETDVGGTLLVDWVEDLIDGTTSHVSP